MKFCDFYFICIEDISLLVQKTLDLSGKTTVLKIMITSS